MKVNFRPPVEFGMVLRKGREKRDFPTKYLVRFTLNYPKSLKELGVGML